MKEQEQKSLEFRETIFTLYGFTETAKTFIREHSAIVVHDFASTRGGGFWHPDRQLTELFTAQHEAAVHEFSHVWWHWFRLEHPDIKTDLVRDVVRLADMDIMHNFAYESAIFFARGYVYGIEEWLGWYGNADGQNNPVNLPKDVHNLTEEDFAHRVNDWEIFAGLCSWTMGSFKTGPRTLPEFMWKYFTPLFTGTVATLPYYMHGNP